MRPVVQFVADHEGCSIDDVRNYFEETPQNEIETLVIQAHEQGLIDARLTYTQMIEGRQSELRFHVNN